MIFFAAYLGCARYGWVSERACRYTDGAIVADDISDSGCAHRSLPSLGDNAQWTHPGAQSAHLGVQFLNVVVFSTPCLVRHLFWASPRSTNSCTEDSFDVHLQVVPLV